MTSPPSVNDLFYGAVACGLIGGLFIVLVGSIAWYWLA